MTDEQWRVAWRLCQETSGVSHNGRDAFIESAVTDPDVARHVRAVLEESAVAPITIDRLKPGARVGRYLLLSVVGKGGMGEVYSAQDTELDRKLALKFLAADASVTASAAERFVREAKAASALNHPNIVTVHEVVRSPWGLAIVMELVEGSSLREHCRNPLPLRRVIGVAGQIAQALSTAHAQGIVHRDIKPENIMLRPDGYIKILDFGLAHTIAPNTPGPDRSVDQSLPAGTWRYMSPEQCRGEQLEPASDVFSLGLVLYEMCTGEHPFPADSPFETAVAIANQAPERPSSRNAAIPLPLDRLILSMLERQPGARPSAAEVARTLHEAEAALRPATVKLGTKGQQVRRTVFAVIAIVLVCAGVVVARLLPRAAKPVSLTQLTNDDMENRVTAAAISPDGNWVAYANADGVFRREVLGGATSPLRVPQGFRVDRIAWFPDGAKLLASGFDRTTLKPSIWVISRAGTEPILFRDDARSGAPSPDGIHVAFTANKDNEIWVAEGVGDRARMLIAGEPSESFPVVFWSADGKRISYERHRHAPKPSDRPTLVEEIEASYGWTYESADSVSGRRLARAQDVAMTSGCALRDGRVLFLRRGTGDNRFRDNVWEVKTDLTTGAFVSKPRRLTALTEDSRVLSLSASAGGDRMTAIINKDEPDVYIGEIGRPGPRLLNARRLTLSSRDDFPHGWTADSKSVYFESDRNGNFDLFKQATDQRVPETVFISPSDEVFPQPTRDGRWLLFVSGTPGAIWNRWRLMRMPAGGGSLTEVLEAGPEMQFRCPLGGNGHCVLRESKGHSEFVFYELDAIRGKGRELARTSWMPSLLLDWDVSPDGSTVAMPYHDPRVGKIRLVSLNGGSGSARERDVSVHQFAELRSVTWAVGMDGWYAAIRTQIGDDLCYIDARGAVRVLHENTNRTWVVPSPDGKHVAFVDGSVDSNVWMFEHF